MRGERHRPPNQPRSGPRCRLTSVFLCLILASTQALAAEAPRNPATYFFQDTFGDFVEELNTAREQDKFGIMLFMEEEECPYCTWMKMRVINQPRVQDWYRKHFLVFTVDVKGDNEVTDFDGEQKPAKLFSKKYNRREMTPTMAFFDLNGSLVYRHLGVVREVDEFLWLGEFVTQQHYLRTKFIRFKKEKRNEQSNRGTSTR